jgi:hypothetical protein
VSQPDLSPQAISAQSESLQDSVSALVAALSVLSVPPSNLDAIAESLRSRSPVMPISELGLDSLGAMELCIHLELEHGLDVTPADLVMMRSTEQLLEMLRL